ncbi:EAL and HDOD domain-containing protein [Hydrogenivirga sp.]
MDLKVYRRAILNAEGEVFAYSFFLETPSSSELPRNILENKITVITIRTLAEYGLKKAGEGKRVFISLPIDTLLVRAYELLSPELTGYRLLPAIVGLGKTVYSQAIEGIEKLRLEGAVISASYELLKEHPDIMQFADLIEFSAQSADVAEVKQVENIGKKVFVSGIDDKGLYDRFVDFADYLEGEFVSKTEKLDQIELAPFLKSTLLRLLVLMNTAQTPNEFAKVIETDVGLSAKLLRFINSAYFALRKKVKSIEQASVYFGLRNIKNFILVLAINDYAAVENPGLWRKALVRAKLMEELSKNVLPDNTSEAYLVGLFSLIDRILDVKIPDFLMEVNVDDLIVSAFTDKESPLAKLLSVATLMEEREEEIKFAKRPEDVKFLKGIADRTRLSPDEVLDIAKRSYIMADTIIHL